MPEANAMDEIVTDETVTLRVTRGQYESLIHDRIAQGRPRVVHKIAVGPFSLPASYVVIGGQAHISDQVSTYWITLAKVSE